MKYHEAVYDPKHAKSIVDPVKLTEWVFREGHKYWDAPVPLLDTHGKIVIPAASRTRAGPTITQAWNGDILVNGKTKIEIIRDLAMNDKEREKAKADKDDQQLGDLNMDRSGHNESEHLHTPDTPIRKQGKVPENETE